MLITLTGSLPDERSGVVRQAHRRFLPAVRDVQKILQPEVIQLPERQDGEKTLLRFENLIFSDKSEKNPAGERIRMFEVRSPGHEVREALRWIKEKILRRGVAPSECVLIVPRLGLYRPLLKAAALEFQVPLFFSAGEEPGSTPAAAALLGLLEVPLGYPRRALFELLRCPFFDLQGLGLQPGDTVLLENICRKGRVTGGREQWQEAFDLLRTEEDPFSETEEPAADDLFHVLLPKGGELQRLREALEGLFTCLEIPSENKTLTFWANWLLTLLTDLDFCRLKGSPQEQISADGSLFEIVKELLQEMLYSERLFGGRELDYTTFTAELQARLRLSMPRESESWRGAVNVLDLLQVRGLRFEAAAVLGLSEGVFPQIERPDPFISEEKRLELGLERQMGREQAGLFYQAVTRADSWLLLTRPYLGESGEAWEPSPYWLAAAALLEESPLTIHTEEFRPLNEAASLQEKFYRLARWLPDQAEKRSKQRRKDTLGAHPGSSRGIGPEE